MHGDPRFRLVGCDEKRLGAEAARSVALENRSAARNPLLDPADPRWVLALRAHAQLQGSALPPERRERLMRMAAELGVRHFDASMIIAIVQDQARRGRRLGESAGTLVRLEPPVRRRSAAVVLRWIAAVAGAIVLNAMLIRWLS